MIFADRYNYFLEKIEKCAIHAGRDSKEITLIAVSKGCSKEEIEPFYQAGCRDFGESRLQESVEKINAFPADIRWHLIGSLQKNKVKKAIASFSLIHSVDSFELAEKISKTAQEMDMEAAVLLQVNTSGEKTKHGLLSHDWEASFSSLLDLTHLKILGLMTIGPNKGSKMQIRDSFVVLRQLRDQLEKKYAGSSLPHLSMGMSEDFEIAIEEGATLLRIGRALFNPDN